MTLPVTSPGGSPPPAPPPVAGNPGGIVGERPGGNQQGWYGLNFANGLAALVYWDGKSWQWGSLKRPPSNLPYTVTFLGSDRQKLFGYGPAIKRFTTWLGQVAGAKQNATLISEIDHGVFGLKGQPVAILPNGKLTWKTSPWTGSEANPVNVIPSPIPPSAGNSHLSNPLSGLLGDFGGLLVRVLEALVGVALLFLGLQALTGTGGQGQPIRTVKRYV